MDYTTLANSSAAIKIDLYGRKAPLRLNVCIVGCGLGGLAAAYALGQAGHQVTVLEAASAIGEVGAGIQLGPNLTRILIRWGLGDLLKQVAVTTQAFTFRRYATGERVGWTKFGDTFERDFGSPYYHIHRADFHNLLLGLATPYMKLRVNSKVVGIDPSAPSVTLESGEVIHADLIIGADGVKSTIREVVVGTVDKPTPTGDAAYRAIVSTDDMVKDPALKHLVDEAEMTGWIGPKRHIMGYCIRAKKEYNIVMVHPDDAATESWDTAANPQKMREEFAGWEPRIQKLLALVPSSLNWKLMDRAPLNNWVHTDGKVALLGDACHPMLPYRAQGSAMAVEDGAVLGNLFSRITHPSQIGPLLRAYQSIRYPRTTETQLASRSNQKTFHFEDGPEQEARDASMRTAMKAALAEIEQGNKSDECVGNANMWADKSRNANQYNYDTDVEVEKWWREHGDSVVAAGPAVSKM